jgi:hypothetical protein
MIRRRPYISMPLSLLMLVTGSLAVAAMQIACTSTGM